MFRIMLEEIINSFADRGLVFSNEQDFQFEFAIALKQYSYVKDVKLEALSLDESWQMIESKLNNGEKIERKQKEYTDIIVESSDGLFYAIELKYKTTDRVCVYNLSTKQKVITMNQGAPDFNAYAFLYDIHRLENINNRYFPNDIHISKGYAIMLTNYDAYVKNDFRKSKIWKNYAINNGRSLPNGDLLFRNNDRIYETDKNRFEAIHLENTYPCLEWKPYKLEGLFNEQTQISPAFNYLIVEVQPIK